MLTCTWLWVQVKEMVGHLFKLLLLGLGEFIEPFAGGD